jgi:hypothetical protein
LVIDPLEETTSADPGLSSGVVVAQVWSGAAVGVTGDEDGEVIEENVGSFELAVTVKVYLTESDSPFTMQNRVPVLEQLAPPGDAVTVYETFDGADHDTRACLSPGLAITLVIEPSPGPGGDWLITML